MTQARRLEGPRAPLFISLAIAAGFAAAPLHAQSVDRADLQRCSDMSAAQLKLACFESLLDSPQPAAVAAEVPPAANTPQVAAAVPAIEEKAVVAAAPQPVATAQPGSNFGDKYVKDTGGGDDQADVTATVTEVDLDSYKRLHFTFANGQIWRQLEARRFQYPKNESFDVVISRGVLGDYQLRVGGEGRMTRIKRVK